MDNILIPVHHMIKCCIGDHKTHCRQNAHYRKLSDGQRNTASILNVYAIAGNGVQISNNQINISMDPYETKAIRLVANP